MLTITKDTIQKYDVPGPRYTSYPTAPEWGPLTSTTYHEKLRQFGQTDKTLSLYVHIPFCQSMCTFCACSVVIRPPDEKHGDQYLKYLFKEIDLIHEAVGSRKKIKQFHWGGGTPTFLSERQIESLFNKVCQAFDVDLDGEVAIEIDPRTINPAKLKKLRQLGFNRVSMGIQDFDASVQDAVNRIQPFDQVKELSELCRELKFGSVNYDLIYGLPKQTPETFSDTVQKVIGLRPDRIALYSFAYVPWLKKHQNKIEESDLPSSDQKIDIFLNARNEFLKSGYQAIAMDHFALKGDEMADAFNNGQLYRNFMGYTVKPADEYIGVGVTSIGFLESTFIQNQKTLPDYYKSLDQNEFPVIRGKELTLDDRIRQWTISELMCRFSLNKADFKGVFDRDFDLYFEAEHDHIKYCWEGGLLKDTPQELKVSELGKIFIRNICMGFDIYLRQKGGHKQFSRTV